MSLEVAARKVESICGRVQVGQQETEDKKV